MHALQILLLIVVAGTAIVTDIRSCRIPNALCLTGILVGSLAHLALGGASALLVEGLGGLLTAGLVLLPLYALGGMAAGDVKLMAAIGCIVGLPFSILAALFSLISGTLLGLAYLALRGGAAEIRDRYWFALRVFVRTLRLALPEAAPDAPSQSRFPYAIAIATGSLVAVALG